MVDCGDFQLTAGARFDGLCNIHYLLVIEIQASDGIVAFGLGGFFFNRLCRFGQSAEDEIGADEAGAASDENHRALN